MLTCISPITGFHFWETCDGLIQTAKQKGRPDNPSGLFLNANAQTPAWPLLASPPPDFCVNARNVHGDTVSLPSHRLQLENSKLQITDVDLSELTCFSGAKFLECFIPHKKKIRTALNSPDSP